MEITDVYTAQKPTSTSAEMRKTTVSSQLTVLISHLTYNGSLQQ